MLRDYKKNCRFRGRGGLGVFSTRQMLCLGLKKLRKIVSREYRDRGIDLCRSGLQKRQN